MLYILFRIIALLIGYCFGLAEAGYILGKIKHVDLKKYGSGNYGATNASRVMGLSMGLLTLLLDTAKPVLAFLLCRLIFMGVSDPDAYLLICLYAVIGAILGHIYPFYLHFKGGKGVASLLGLVLVFVFGLHHASTAWPVLIVPMVLFLLCVAVTRYVSLGSVSAVLVLVLMMLISGENDRLVFAAGSSYLKEWYVLFVIVAVIIIAKHAPNIRRLIRGTENKLYFGKAKKKGQE